MLILIAYLCQLLNINKEFQIYKNKYKILLKNYNLVEVLWINLMKFVGGLNGIIIVMKVLNLIKIWIICIQKKLISGGNQAKILIKYNAITLQGMQMTKNKII